MSVPALFNEFIYREIDVTWITVTLTQYFRPYLRLNLHISSVTIVLQGCNRAVT